MNQFILFFGVGGGGGGGIDRVRLIGYISHT